MLKRVVTRTAASTAASVLGGTHLGRVTARLGTRTSAPTTARRPVACNATRLDATTVCLEGCEQACELHNRLTRRTTRVRGAAGGLAHAAVEVGKCEAVAPLRVRCGLLVFTDGRPLLARPRSARISVQGALHTRLAAHATEVFDVFEVDHCMLMLYTAEMMARGRLLR